MAMANEQHSWGSFGKLALFICASFLFAYYLKANAFRVSQGLKEFPHLLAPLLASDIKKATCLPLSYDGKSQDSHCSNGFRRLLDGALARDLSLGIEERASTHTINFHGSASLAFSLSPHQLSELKTIACGLRDIDAAPQENREAIKCKGLLLPIPLQVGNQAIIEFRIHLPAATPLALLTQLRPVVYLSSQARVDRTDSNGWGWFEPLLHREPEIGDPIYLEATYQWPIGLTEKMPRVAHNRAIYPGVGAWPGDGRLLRMVSAQDFSYGAAFDEYPEEGVLIDRAQYLGPGQVQVLSVTFSLPTLRAVDAWYIGLKGPQIEEIPIEAMEIASLAGETKELSVLHLSAVAFDVVQALVRKGACGQLTQACIKDLVAREIPHYLSYRE
jgi:hypothetical protein